MTARERTERARAMLLVTLAAAALLWSMAAFGATALLVALVDQASPLRAVSRSAGLWLAALAGAGAVLYVLWRGRHARNLVRVALYLEERVPSLSWALVSAVGAAPTSALPALEQQVDRVDLSGALRPGVARSLAIPGALLALLLLALTALPGETLERVLHPRADDILEARGAPAPSASRLTPIVVRITPPAYTGESPRDEADPAVVSALAGSLVEVRGRGAMTHPLDSLRGVLEEAILTPVQDAGRWTISFPLPARPAALRLTDRGYQRLLGLEPVPDLAPVVILLTPSRDTTYNTPTGRITLAASALDDIGLARAAFEILHTSGTGERFRTGRREIAGVTLGRARSARITAALLLDTMRLGPGDVLHIRGLAADRRPFTGYSDTRTIRIADPRRRDTVSIQLALEIPLDTSVLSQRALVIRAESLLRRERRLGPPAFRRQAVELGVRQRQLRERVEEIVEEIETESEDVRVGTTVVSRLLSQAASAMIDAENELGAAAVFGARPHMYRALRLLQQARDATARYYLRGPLPKVVVDLARARLRGRDSASVSAREGRPAMADARRALLARLDRAVALAGSVPAASADSVTLLRLAALTQAPDAAEPLGRAAEALRSGRDAAVPLREARRALERRTEGSGGLSSWQAAP